MIVVKIGLLSFITKRDLWIF